jgi:hypothetical protein
MDVYESECANVHEFVIVSESVGIENLWVCKREGEIVNLCGCMYCIIGVVFFFVSFWCYWVGTQGLTLARQALYPLSHTSCPFCFIFELGSCIYAQAGLNHDYPVSPHPAFVG